MSVPTKPETWKTLDTWWTTFRDSESVPTVPQSALNLDTSWFEGCWEDLDSWWEVYVAQYSLPEVTAPTATLDRRLYDSEWDTLDPWWKTFSEQRQADAITLADQLDTLETVWQTSSSRFDTDPLAVDWTAHTNTRGPLRPNQEENWSQWLGHLLRAGSPQFVADVFGTNIENHPDAVCREEHLPARVESRPDRYADILVFYGDTGLSIEIKKGDEHYEKTAHTAELIETKYSHIEWTHYLLLPKYKLPALRSSFGPALEETADRLRLNSDSDQPISIVYWQDISRTIREHLLNETAANDLWAASAYTFATLIEQKILDFTPEPEVAQLAAASSIVETATSLSVAAGDVEEQLTYLQSFGGHTDEQ